LACALVAVDASGRVFLVRHTYVPGWHLPGGGVETGETLAEAMAKELREEANIRLTGPPQLHGVCLNRHVSPRDHVAVFRRPRVRSGRPAPAGQEIAECRVFRP
jgi:8-oxo-dGTP pyrophosphatase MutT (NUDIX family)